MSQGSSFLSHLIRPLALAAIGGTLLTTSATGQDARAKATSPPPRGGEVLDRDLVAVFDHPTFAEQNYYNAENPCAYHTDARWAYVKLRQVLATPLPSGTKATLFKEGQVLATWDVVTQAGPSNQSIHLGTFKWTVPHPCPVPGTASSTPGPPTYKYRLVIDPGNQVAEASELNNSVEFRVNQIATFVKIP